MLAYFVLYSTIDDESNATLTENTLAGFGATATDAIRRAVDAFCSPDEWRLCKVDIATGATVATLPLAPILQPHGAHSTTLYAADLLAYTRAQNAAETRARARANVSLTFIAANEAYEAADNARRATLDTLHALLPLAWDDPTYVAARATDNTARLALLAARDASNAAHKAVFDATLAADTALAAAKETFTAALLDLLAADLAAFIIAI